MAYESQVPRSPLSEIENPRNRRGFLKFVSKIGIGTIGGMAAMNLMPQAAQAAPQIGPACCDLYYNPPNCPYSGGYPYCPNGTMKTWTCCAGSPPFQRLYACGECNDGSSCWSAAHWYCSAYWTVRANSC